MGGSSSTHEITQEMLEEYSQLTYLTKAEILHIYRRFKTLGSDKLAKDYHHRFPFEDIMRIFPQIRVRTNRRGVYDTFTVGVERYSIAFADHRCLGAYHNPFRDSIMRVFSSEQDDHFSFEDTLDLCSVMTENCPEEIRAAWAFRIFDFDCDNQLSLDDLMEAVERLTGLNEDGEIRIDRATSEHIAQVVLREMDMDHTGCIAPQEFVHIVARMPEFAHTFRFMA